jgi:hypothetical protein
LTNTLVYSRSLVPLWSAYSITPTPTYSNAEEGLVSWVYSSTYRREFELILDEPWLGSDLVVEELSMSNPQPTPGEPVVYTVTVRNDGADPAGRPILTEMLVRPYNLGAPVQLDDHEGGWSSYGDAALIKWLDASSVAGLGADHVDFPIAASGGVEGEDRFQAPAASYWWPGLAPGESVTGATTMYWPDECEFELCQVWTKVDPAYVDLGYAYEWYGYLPEGYSCEHDAQRVPLCAVEMNNVASFYDLGWLYLPMVARDAQESD